MTLYDPTPAAVAVDPISSLGGQITMLALPVTAAAVLLKATPSQMGC